MPINVLVNNARKHAFDASVTSHFLSFTRFYLFSLWSKRFFGPNISVAYTMPISLMNVSNFTRLTGFISVFVIIFTVGIYFI